MCPTPRGSTLLNWPNSPAKQELCVPQAAIPAILARFGTSSDEVLRRAQQIFAETLGAASAARETKRELVRQFDLEAMTRAVNLVHWGRSGSFLFASYLDHHPEIVMLPMLTSMGIYAFFEAYAALSIWEKLLAYPAYSALKNRSAADFFLKDNPDGNIAINAADFHAAVQALHAEYAGMPAAWLESRPRFFQMLQAAHSVAAGQRLETRRPVMVWAQHYVDEEWARRFVEDFPDGQFIHTIRDPITGIDSWFGRQMEMEIEDYGFRPELAPRYLDPALGTLVAMLRWDGAHAGTQTRSRAVRFEDMHLQPEALMRRLADWIGVGYHPCLLKSTWNGVPYVVIIRGVSTCGPNPVNAQRRHKYLNYADRLVVFALLQGNFAAWKYPYPQALRSGLLRLCTLGALWLVPMRMELATWNLVLRRQAIPAWRNGRRRFALGAPLFLLARRLRMMVLIATETSARMRGKRRILQLL
jgi:hypothetical protein